MALEIKIFDSETNTEKIALRVSDQTLIAQADQIEDPKQWYFDYIKNIGENKARLNRLRVRSKAIKYFLENESVTQVDLSNENKLIEQYVKRKDYKNAKIRMAEDMDKRMKGNIKPERKEDGSDGTV